MQNVNFVDKCNSLLVTCSIRLNDVIVCVILISKVYVQIRGMHLTFGGLI